MSPNEREALLRVKAQEAWATFLAYQSDQDRTESEMMEAYADWQHARHDHLAALAAIGRRAVS